MSVSKKEKEKLKLFIDKVRNQWSKNRKEDLISSPVCSLNSEFSEEEVHEWVEEKKRFEDNVIRTCLEKIRLSLCSPSLREERLFEKLKEFEEIFARVRNRDVRKVKRNKRQREEEKRQREEKKRQREEEKKRKEKKKKKKATI